MIPLAAVLAGVLATGAGIRWATHTSGPPALYTEGIAADPCAPQDVIIVPAHHAVRYDGVNSSVLLTGSGPAASAGHGAAAASGCTSAGRPRTRLSPPVRAEGVASVTPAAETMTRTAGVAPASAASSTCAAVKFTVPKLDSGSTPAVSLGASAMISAEPEGRRQVSLRSGRNFA